MACIGAGAHAKAPCMANDEANGRAPWTIKGMDVETRKLVVNCAAQRGQSVATWLETAVRNQANLEAGDRIEMPGQPGQTAPQNGQTGFGLDELEQFARVCSLLAESAGKPVPRTVTRLMWARVRERLGSHPTDGLGAGDAVLKIKRQHPLVAGDAG
jgi:hypothetical protein